MAHEQLEKRYKKRCQDAAGGKIQRDVLDGSEIEICPLDRNFPTTALVLRMEHDRVLPMRPLSSIFKETARRIDANAKSLEKTARPKNADLVVVESKTLVVCLANLCSHQDGNKGRHGLGLHLLPFTIGNWIAGIRGEDDTKGWKATEEKLTGICQHFANNDRFRYVVVHQSYAGLPRGDGRRKKSAQSMLQFSDKKNPIINVLGEDLDAVDASKTSDSNIVGLYLCRKSIIEFLEAKRPFNAKNGRYSKLAPVLSRKLNL